MDAITKFIMQAQRDGVPVPPSAEAALRKSLTQFGGTLDQQTVEEFLQKFHDGLKSIIRPEAVPRHAADGTTTTVTEGATPASLGGDLARIIARFASPAEIISTLNLPFKISVATNVMQGAARLLSQNFDQDELDEFPALELTRVYDVNVPRGLRIDRVVKKVPTLVADPENDWPHRWAAAGAECGDDDWLPWDGDWQTGRGVALKSSGIWQLLGDGAGGYQDTLGNAFPPFAFNSGFDVNGVPRKECIRLGLLDAEGMTTDDDGNKIPPQRADVDWENLFAHN